MFPKKSKSTTTTKKISPFLIQSDEHSRKVMDTLDEARFNLRFSFLNDDANDDEGGSSWESYRKDRDELCSESEEEVSFCLFSFSFWLLFSLITLYFGIVKGQNS